MSRKRTLLKQISLYSLSTQLTQAITLFAALLSRRFLGPTQVGIWSSLQLVLEYSKYASLGSIHAIVREVPYFLGKGDTESAKKISNAVFTSLTGTSLIIGSGFVLFALINRGRISVEITNGLYLMAAVVFLHRLNDFLINLMRSHKLFQLASAQMIVSAIVNSILVALFTYYFKIYGFIWAMILSYLFNIAFIQFHHPFPMKFCFEPAAIARVIRFGLPLLIFGVLMLVFRSLDRIFILRHFGFEAMGFYNIALMISGYLMNVPYALANVLIPHYTEHYSVTSQANAMEEVFYKSVHAHALLMILLIGATWAAAPAIIYFILPQFAPGVASMKILVAGIYFLTLYQAFSDLLVTIRRLWVLTPLVSAAIIFSFICMKQIIAAGLGIDGIAMGANAGFVFLFLIAYFVLALQVSNFGRAIKHFFILIGYFGLLMGILLAMDTMIPTQPLSFLNPFIRLLFFMICATPYLFAFEYHFSVLNLVKTWISKRGFHAKQN